MKEMKKSLALLIAVLTLISLCACGSSKEDAPANNDTPPYALGVVNGSTYESPYLGIGCTLDENWVFYDYKQMMDIMVIEAEVSDYDDYRQKMLQEANYYEMYAAEDSETASTLNVSVENLGKALGNAIEIDDYVNSIFSDIANGLESQGFEDTDVELLEKEIAGKDCRVIKISAVFADVPVFISQALFKVENHIVMIYAGSCGEDITEGLLDNFYSLS